MFRKREIHFSLHSNRRDSPHMRSPAVLALVSLTAIAAVPAADPVIKGFTAESSKSEMAWEVKLKAIPDPSQMRESMRLLSARPHHVGSPYDKQNAEWLRDQFKSYGWQAEIETFDVLFPTPKQRVVELVAPTKFVANLDEPPVEGDPTSNQQSEQLPAYNAYSADGDVTGPLVFVNYGVPADYEELERRGISVKGAIVIAKYGGSWRGIKPKVAAEHGAVGCLIYSDPGDDGYAGGDVFPAGQCVRRKVSAWICRRHANLSRGSFNFPDRAKQRTQSFRSRQVPTLQKSGFFPIRRKNANPFSFL